MQSHGPIHDDLLERLVVGDVPRSSSEARALLDGCEICREKLRELERLQAELGRAGMDEREGLVQSGAMELTPGMELGLKRFAESRVSRRGSSSRWLRAAALLVAASVVAALGYRMFEGANHDDPTREDRTLGPEEDNVLPLSPPERGAERWEDFEWSARALAADESFTLSITNLDQPEPGPLVVDTIKTTQWKRSAARRVDSRRVEEFFARNPRRIEWSVVIRKGSGFLGQYSPRQSSLD